MNRLYSCETCGRADAEPLEMKECGAGCGEIFCAGCLPDHEAVCAKRPDTARFAGQNGVDFDERIGG